MSPLSQSARVAAELRQRLATEYNLAEDDEAIDDTVSGEVDLPEQIARLARDALQAEAFAEGLGGLIKVEQTRKARLEAKAEKARALIAWAMSEAGYTKMPLPDMTLSMGKGRAPLIVDEGAELPEAYRRVKVEPDKAFIRAALDSGVELDFARLGNAKPSLTIRRT